MNRKVLQTLGELDSAKMYLWNLLHDFRLTEDMRESYSDTQQKLYLLNKLKSTISDVGRGLKYSRIPLQNHLAGGDFFIEKYMNMPFEDLNKQVAGILMKK